MGNQKNVRKRPAKPERRERRLEVSRRREQAILVEAEQERLRELREAQRRDYHRTWRTRSRANEVRATVDDVSGEGPSGTVAEEDPPIAESQHEETAELPREYEEDGGGPSTAAEAEEDIEGVTQSTDSGVAAVDDIEGEGGNPRNRKCFYLASKGVSDLMRMLDAGLSEEEQKIVLRRFFSDDRIRAKDPELTAAVLKLRTVPTTTVQSLRGALQTIRSGSIQGKAKVRNIVLTAAVSKGDSQRMIGRALGASRYLVRKAFQRRAEVDETGENLWAGRDRKRRSDALSAEETTAVCSWWETETTVSPNKKDVKRRRIGVKEHETHATHYLQVSQERTPQHSMHGNTGDGPEVDTPSPQTCKMFTVNPPGGKLTSPTEGRDSVGSVGFTEESPDAFM